MSGEIHRADWTIPYPVACDAESVAAVLQPLTHFEHGWESFPWHLTGRLVGLLEQPEASFDYFYLTVFFSARAAMLALSGNVLYRKEVFGALSRYRVQVAGIYRAHLLHYLRLFLDKHNFVQLPDCEARLFDSQHSTEAAERNREMVQRVVEFAEADYMTTLSFISLATDMEEEVCGHSVGYWVKGGEMPAPVGVRVKTSRHEYGHDWMPTRDEAKAAYRAKRPVRAVAVRVQREFGGMVNGSWVMGGGTDGRPPGEDRGPQTIDQRPGREGRGPTRVPANVWKVVGDYRVIKIPGSKPINLMKKHKARAVVGFIHRALTKAGAGDFYVDEMRDEFNAQFTDAMAGKRWMSDRFREDLFKGKEREFDLLFEILERASGHYRIKACGLVGFLWWLGSLADGGLGDWLDWAVADGTVGDWGLVVLGMVA